MHICIRRLVTSLCRTRNISSSKLSSGCLPNTSPLLRRPTTCSILRRDIWSSACLPSSVIPFNLSDIGEGIHEVTITEWYVKEGDHVKQFDNVCEVQSDKASVTITSRYDGVVVKLHHDEGTTAKTGEALLDIQVADDVTLPQKESGDHAISKDGEVGEPTTTGDRRSTVLCTPAVRRIAREYNIDLVNVTATGPKGRVLKEDVMRYVSGADESDEIVTVTNDLSINSQNMASTGDLTVKFTPIVKAMCKLMKQALEIPHFGYKDEYNVTGLIQLRNSVKRNFKHLLDQQSDAGHVKLTFMPFILKAMSIALTNHPSLNASFNSDSETVVWHADHNIGIAIDTAYGLVVPNVKRVQNSSPVDIAIELDRLMTDAMKGRLKKSDLAGSTVTVSNIGSIGGTYMSPVIPPPTVLIGAFGRTRTLPVFDETDDEFKDAIEDVLAGKVSANSYDWSEHIVPSHMMAVSWSADHRVVDGATVAKFSNQVHSLLQSPDKMLLHLR